MPTLVDPAGRTEFNAGAQYRDLNQLDAAELLFLYLSFYSSQTNRGTSLPAQTRRDAGGTFFA
jgi:hypothetical protein